MSLRDIKGPGCATGLHGTCPGEFTICDEDATDENGAWQTEYVVDCRCGCHREDDEVRR